MIKNLKKLISSFAAVAIIASSASAFAVTFPDVDESASYANAVETLTALGIVNGDDNGKFNPDNSVTRAEFAKMVVEALGEGAAASSSSYTKFEDAKSHWAAGYIEMGVAKQFINGYDETTFGPDDKVTYAQGVKMLVAAIGYDLWASEQGGWPSGYLAWGSQLGIIKGVTGVTNDTELTRAQCAVLVNNALKAPICEIVRYENVGMYGDIVKPVYDQRDGEDKDWKSLLTEKHNAYVVKGRVSQSTKQTGEIDEVQFTVELSDRYIDNTIKSGDTPVSHRMHFGDTDANNMLFTYAEAVVVLDDDTDEKTIISIEPYGISEKVTFLAEDIYASDISNINGNGSKVTVYTSSSTKKAYEVAGLGALKAYVNGYSVQTELYTSSTAGTPPVTTYTWNQIDTSSPVDGVVDTTVFEDNYLNPTVQAEITLIDETTTASTSTDGIYDAIMVKYVEDEVVNNVQESTAKVTVYFESGNKLQWTPEEIEDGDRTITFTLDGEEIAYTDLQQYDVLSVEKDPSASLTGSKELAFAVSRNTVTGVVTSTDPADYEIKVDGQTYDVVPAQMGSIKVSNEYTLYLNANGVVVKAEEGETNKDYGVLVGMIYDDVEEAWEIRVVTAEGKVESYPAKTDLDAIRFAEVFKEADIADNATLSKADATYVADNPSTPADEELHGGGHKLTRSVADKIGFENLVVAYKISAGEIKFAGEVDATPTAKREVGKGGSVKYNAAMSKLGSYTIDDSVTTIVDMSTYATNSTVGVLTMESFEDEATYGAYMFDKNNNGEYRFAVVTSGLGTLRPTSDIAVVKEVVGAAQTEDGTDVTELLVVRNGQEDVSVLVVDSIVAAKGDVIAYVVGSEGYVETANYKTIYSAESSYADLRATATMTTTSGGVTTPVANTFVDALAMTGAAQTDGGKLITYDGGTTVKPDTEFYFGPVYRKVNNSLELVDASNASHQSDIANLISLNVAGANTYIYNFAERVDKVSVAGGFAQSNTIFVNSYGDADKTIIDWAKVVTNDVQPAFALVKTNDGDVTDVVYFIAE